MIEKKTAIEALEAYQGQYKGLSASVVAGCIQVIRDLPEEDGWIPVKDGLPEEFVSVLVHIPGERPLPTVKEAYVVSDMWYTWLGVFPLGDVSHWKPMPEPPKEEK